MSATDTTGKVVRIDIEQAAQGRWVPAIKKLALKDTLPAEEKYERLCKHHEEETEYLMRVIQILAIQLQQATQDES